MINVAHPARVAFIAAPVIFGGAERVSLNLLAHADRTTFDFVPILLVRPWEADTLFVSRLRQMGYPFYTVPVARRPSKDHLRLLRCFFSIFTIVKSIRAQLMHTQGYFADIIGAVVSRLLQLPHVSTCHGFVATDRRLKLYNSLDYMALKSCDRIIAVSEDIRHALTGNGIDAKRIAVIPNSVGNGAQRDRSEIRQALGLAKEGAIIGYAGRLSPEKGVNFLLQAAQILKNSRRAFSVVIAGEGSERDALQRMAEEKDLEETIIFTGFQEDVEPWLKASDIFVLPSLTEGTPMALLEAMSLGLPVIASAVGGVPDIIENGVNGILVRPADCAGLAEALAELLDNPWRARKIGEAAAKSIKERYNIDAWRREIEAQYRLALASPKKNRSREGDRQWLG